MNVQGIDLTELNQVEIAQLINQLGNRCDKLVNENNSLKQKLQESLGKLSAIEKLTRC